MSSPPQILSFIDWYEPAFKAGGPVRSMVNLVNLLKGNAALFVMCGNKEIDGTLLNIEYNQWTKGNQGEQVFYTSTPSLKQLKSWKKENPNGVFHINGIYSLKFSILPLLFAKYFFPKTKVIVSPRGMLNKGALEIKSSKKQVFLTLAKLLGLFKKVTWHATSDEEKSRIKNVFPSVNPIQVLSNVPVAPSKTESRPPKIKGQLKMYTATRVVPIKKLETILKALTQFPVQAPIVFDVYGPIEDKHYADSLQELAKNITDFELNFKGSIEPHKLQQSTANYHLFCLPSANENFGHSIYEAFAAACPVLISDQTPWKNLYPQKVGFDLPLAELQPFSNAISMFTNMTQQEWEEWSNASLQFAKQHYLKEEWLHSYLTLFANNEREQN